MSRLTEKDVRERAWRAMEREADRLVQLAEELLGKIEAKNRGKLTSREAIKALFPVLSRMGSSLDSIRRDRRYLQQQEKSED